MHYIYREHGHDYPLKSSNMEEALKEGHEMARNGDYQPEDHTFWLENYVVAITEEDGEEIEDERIRLVTAIHPEEPECSEEEHDWQSPHHIVGGLKENPGVYGHGGGVIQTEVCMHCNRLRKTDTWAQNPATGEQGLTSVTYMDNPQPNS